MKKINFSNVRFFIKKHRVEYLIAGLPIDQILTNLSFVIKQLMLSFCISLSLLVTLSQL